MLFQFQHINTFLDQAQPRRLFFFARFPRYRDFVNLLKYDEMYCGTSLQNFDIVYGSL